MAKGRIPAGDRKLGNSAPVGGGKLARPAVVDPKLATIDAPEGLEGYAAEVWRVCVVEMAANAHLHEPDLAMLRAYVDQVQVNLEAAAHVREYGVMIRVDQYDDEGEIKGTRYVANPAVKVARDAATAMRQLSDVLGLNPLARIRGNLMDAAAGDMVGSLRERLLKQLQAK